MKLTIDFETRSRAEIKDVGTYAYAQHPSTEVMCMAAKLEDGAPKILVPEVFAAMLPAGHGLPLATAAEIFVPEITVIEAHNAMFEFAIWNSVCAPRHGWPILKPEQITCSMALASMFALPRKLASAGEALGLDIQKDAVGHRLMLKMCKPKKDGSWHEKPEDLVALYRYCIQDVEAEHALSTALGGSLPPSERRIWALSVKMNDRGIRVDIPAVKAIRSLVQQHEEKLLDRMAKMTWGKVKSPKQVAAFVHWVNAKHESTLLQSADKAAISAALERKDIGPEVREALEIRQSLGKASTAKYEAFLNMTCADGRLRNNLVYHGASTGRYAGTGVQLQNLPRPHKGFKAGVSLPALATGDLEYSQLVLDDPMPHASSALRSMIVAEDGKDLVVADYSSIEARNVMWLAEENEAVQMFRDGADIYCEMAGAIFHRKVTKDDKLERQLGKTCVAEGSLVLTDNGLKPIENVSVDDMVWDGVEWVRHDGVIYQGRKPVISYCGLSATADHGVFTQGGPVPFGLAACGHYQCIGTELNGANLPVGEDYIARDYTSDEAHACVDQVGGFLLGWHSRKAPVYDILNCGPRGRYTVSGVLVLNCILGCGYGMGVPKFLATCHSQGLDIDEDLAAKAVQAYRTKYSKVPMLWYALERAAKQAIKEKGVWFPAKLVRWMCKGRFLRCRLPSGRMLWYMDPVISTDEYGEGITFMGVDTYTKKWSRQKTFGGKLCENVVSAISRDIMTNAMLNLENAGYEVVMTVHDEIISEVPKDFGSVEEFIEIMTQPIGWAPGCAIGAEGWRADRYKK